MQILYTPKDAEDYLLDTANHFKTPAQTRDYSKDEEVFDLHEDFNAVLKIQTDMIVSKDVNVVEVTTILDIDDSSTESEITQLIDGTKREVSHIIKRSFPGRVEIDGEIQESDCVHKTEYQITFN